MGYGYDLENQISKIKYQNYKLKFKNFELCSVILMVQLRSPSTLSVVEGLIFTF